jgi:non-heme chloroperoxidase
MPVKGNPEIGPSPRPAGKTVAALVLALLAAGCAHGALVRGARSGFVRLPDSVRLHYLEKGRGAGPTLVFVPGWTIGADIWEPQIEWFARSHRVVAVDPRGQGLSSKTTEGLYPAARARDLHRVVEELHLAPVVLVGWSMGASEVAMYVDQFGTRDIAGIVLVDSSLGGEPDPQRVLAVVQWLGEMQSDRRKATADFVRSMFKHPQPEDYLSRITSEALATPTSSAVALFVGSIASSTRAALAKIDKPTLIVYASSAVSSPAYERMHDAIAGSRLERFPDAGHALFVDDAGRFNALLEEFVAGLR